MIQRKQTLFLLVAFVLAVVCMSTQLGSYQADGMVSGKVYSLWITDSVGNRHFTTWPLMAIMLPTAVLMLTTIFLYSKRLVQAKLCTACIFLLIAWYIVFIVVTGDGMSYAVTTALPAISALLCLMARKAILADEKLVRSVDRIR